MPVPSQLSRSRLESNASGPAPDIHRYRLWRDVEKRDDGALITHSLDISMGEHGAMKTSSFDDSLLLPVASTSQEGHNDLAGDNLAEMRRAMEEGKRWELRLTRSPLGKTQQDFVAYYTEVLALFADWCTAHGITIPD